MGKSVEQMLDEDWAALASAMSWPPEPAAAVGRDVIDRYSEPARAYHNCLHLLECLTELSEHAERVPEGCHDPQAVATALWFHDAVYDPRRSDNEVASADFAIDRLTSLGEDPEWIARVRGLILDTDHQAEAASADGRLVADIDLSILGKNPGRFDNYDRAIRTEYAHVPPDAYRRGRLIVLRRFFARPAIYRTPAMSARYEVSARENLARAIRQMEGDAEAEFV